jgi:hypothetical protein
MTRKRKRESVARPITPPESLIHTGGQVKTPSRSAVLTLKLTAQKLGVKIDQSTVYELTGVAPRDQTRIIASREVRTLHNREDIGPDPRGRKRAFTRSDTRAIADYLSDSDVDLNEKGKPWLDIAEDAGVEIPKTMHIKPPGVREIEPRSLLRAAKADEGIGNFKCPEEKLLTQKQADNRLDFKEEQLAVRPRSKNWKDVVFCDEFHLGIGPQVTKRIKRKVGKAHRYSKKNIHRKKLTSKDTKAKAREENHLPLLNVFLVIGFDYRRMVSYSVSNDVGKMTTKEYTETVLPAIRGDLWSKGLTLCQDADSAHTSKATEAFCRKNHIDFITLPGVSPDFSIFETLAQGLKKKFHARRCTTVSAAKARFERIWIEELDQNKVKELYSWYTKRLHECERQDGQMTRY